MLGYDRETLTVLKIQMLHPPKEKSKAKKALMGMSKTRKINFESQFIRADGKIIDVDISARLLKNKENYDNVKGRTDPNNIFRDLYTKTCRTMMGLER